MTNRRPFQFGISTLLVVTTVAAIALTIIPGSSVEGLLVLIWLAVFTSGAVVCIVWTGERHRGEGGAVVVPCIAYHCINGAAWLAGVFALRYIDGGLRARTDVSQMGCWLLAAHQYHALTVFAVVCLGVLTYAAWRRDAALLAGVGAAMVLGWLMLFAWGFLVAAVHLVVVR